jgi:hypothetical protein
MASSRDISSAQSGAVTGFFFLLFGFPVGIGPLIFCTHLHLKSTVIRRTRRRKTGNLEINQCSSDIRKCWTASGLLTGHWWGKWKARDDYEYRDFESTLYILIFKKEDGRLWSGGLMKPRRVRSDGLL